MFKIFNSLYEIIVKIAAFCVKQVLRPCIQTFYEANYRRMNTPRNATQMLE
jgi:hypothetical protein